MARSHYDVLGSPATASQAELRKAYLKRARLLHPDQFTDRPAAEQAKAQRGMQELNAAWTVLSDPDKRRAYDLAELAKRKPASTDRVVSGRSDGWTPFDAGSPTVPPRPKPGPQVADEREMEIRGVAKLIRPFPLLALFGTMVLIVIVAVALSGGSDGGTVVTPPPEQIEQPAGAPLGCIDLNPVFEVPCGQHQGLVWDVVDVGETCREGLEAVYAEGQGGLYCITRTE